MDAFLWSLVAKAIIFESYKCWFWLGSPLQGAAGRKRRGVTGCLDRGRVKACVQCPRLTAGADQAKSGQLE